MRDGDRGDATPRRPTGQLLQEFEGLGVFLVVILAANLNLRFKVALFSSGLQGVLKGFGGAPRAQFLDFRARRFQTLFPRCDGGLGGFSPRFQKLALLGKTADPRAVGGFKSYAIEGFVVQVARVAAEVAQGRSDLLLDQLNRGGLRNSDVLGFVKAVAPGLKILDRGGLIEQRLGDFQDVEVASQPFDLGLERDFAIAEITKRSQLAKPAFPKIERQERGVRQRDQLFEKALAAPRRFDCLANAIEAVAAASQVGGGFTPSFTPRTGFVQTILKLGPNRALQNGIVLSFRHFVEHFLLFIDPRLRSSLLVEVGGVSIEQGAHLAEIGDPTSRGEEHLAEMASPLHDLDPSGFHVVMIENKPANEISRRHPAKQSLEDIGVGGGRAVFLQEGVLGRLAAYQIEARPVDRPQPRSNPQLFIASDVIIGCSCFDPVEKLTDRAKRACLSRLVGTVDQMQPLSSLGEVQHMIRKRTES